MVTPYRVCLCEHEAPDTSVVVECARGEPEEQRLLRVVEHPEQIPVGGNEGHKRCGFNFLGNCVQHRARASKVALRERSEEHTSELQSRLHLVCRLLLEKKKKTATTSD